MLRIKLRELRLRHFRAFTNARLVLDDVTFLVGRNAAGKSTLMDALGFLSEALTDGLGIALERRGNLEGIRQRQSGKSKNGDVSIAACFEVVQSSPPMESSFPVGSRLLYGFRLGQGSSKANFVVEEEVFRDSSDSSLHRDGRVIRIGDKQTQVDARSDLLFMPLFSTRNEDLFNIYEEIIDIRFYQMFPRVMKVEFGIGSETRLRNDGGNAGDILKRTSKEDRAWIVEHLGAAVAGIRGVKATARAGRRVIVFSQEDESGRTQQFDASMMSDGTMRSLGILLALRQSPRPSAVLIDEIEDSLHPFAQSVLLDAIESASVEFPVVVSTHNPEILSHPSARPDRIRVIQWEEGSSKVYHLSESIRNELKPPETVGRLLRSNALWTEDEPSTCGPDDDFFKI